MTPKLSAYKNSKRALSFIVSGPGIQEWRGWAELAQVYSEV